MKRADYQKLTPAAKALSDHKHGVYDSNPYSYDTKEYWEYVKTLHPLLSMDEKRNREELLAGV